MLLLVDLSRVVRDSVGGGRTRARMRVCRVDILRAMRGSSVVLLPVLRVEMRVLCLSGRDDLRHGFAVRHLVCHFRRIRVFIY